MRGHSWLELVVSVSALGALGAGLGSAVSGKRLRWVVTLILMGVLVAAIGAGLDIT